MKNHTKELIIPGEKKSYINGFICLIVISTISKNESEQRDEDYQKKYLTNMRTVELIIFRYKRIILAYLSKRMDVIEKYFWEFG